MNQSAKSKVICERTLTEFTEGRSGSPVLLVDVTSSSSNGPQGHRIVKIIQIRKNRNELDSREAAGITFGAFIPQIVMHHKERLDLGAEGPVSKGTFLAIVYNVAQGSLLYARTLRVLMKESASEVENYAHALAETIYEVWEKHVNSESLKPLPLVTQNMLRSLVQGSKSVTKIAGQILSLDTKRPLIGLTDIGVFLPYNDPQQQQSAEII